MWINRQIVLTSINGSESAHNILYGFAPTPFGEILIGFNSGENDAICHLHFVLQNPKDCLLQLRKRWPLSKLTENSNFAKKQVEVLFNNTGPQADVTAVLASGTAFQLQIWQALLRIPAGETRTYTEVAEMAGNSKATRAAANAVANNEIAMLIPCHRVVPKAGNMLKYRWGGKLKQKLLECEKS